MELLKLFSFLIVFSLSSAVKVFQEEIENRYLKTGGQKRFPECPANPVCAAAGLKGLCCPTSDLAFLDCCFETLTPSPTLSAGTRSCQPTSGECASTAVELQAMFDKAKRQEVIAICDGRTIIVTSAIEAIVQSLTLCCAGSGCVIQRNDDNIDTNLLIIYGSSFTVEGISFVNGKAGTSPSYIDPNTITEGGNLYIFATGNHKVINCNFRGGQAVNGANLSVRAYDDGSTVTIQDSTFIDGLATYGAGGALIDNVDNVTISNCNFVGNSAGISSAALSLFTGFSNFDFPDRKKISIIEDSYFGSNTASRFGCAFDYSVDTSIGTLATLSILNTVFEDNVCTEELGGLGYITAGECVDSPFLNQFGCFNTVELILSGNSGTGNSGENSCDGILANLPKTQTCFPVDEELFFS